MIIYNVVSLPGGHILGGYWHPPGPNIDPEGPHWGQSFNFSELLKAMGVQIYWWNLTVSVWGLIFIDKIVPVCCQSHTGIPRVAVIQ